MCGIIGYKPLEEYDAVTRIDAFRRLFEQSCIRGMHAYGISAPENTGDERGDWVSAYRTFDQAAIAPAFGPNKPAIAHARYCQSGDWRVLENNQPIAIGNMALAFNGCIDMGTKAEFEAAFNVTCESDNDGEIFLRKIAGATTVGEAAREAEDFVGSIRGSFAGVWLMGDRLIVSRNSRRPLWRCVEYGAKWYASTADIFRRAGFVGAEPVPVGTEIA